MESNEYNEFFSDDFNINNLCIDFIHLKKKDVVYTYKMSFENTYSNRVRKREKHIIDDEAEFELKKSLNSDLLEKSDYKVLENERKKYEEDNFNIFNNYSSYAFISFCEN